MGTRGALAGAVALVALLLADLALGRVLQGAPWPGGGGMAWALLWGAGLGAVLGLAQGGLAGLLWGVAGRLGSREALRRWWAAALAAALAIPAAAHVAVTLLGGRKARLLPGHDLWVAALALLLTAGLLLAVRAAIAAVAGAGRSRRAAAGVGLTAVAAALVALAGDRLVVPGRYPVLHASAQVGAFLLMQIGALALVRVPVRPPLLRLVAPLAIVIPLAAAAALPGAGAGERHELVRGRVCGASLVAANLVGLAGRAGLLAGEPVAAVAEARPERPASVPRASRSQPDLILVTIDALRADRLGTYGYGRPTSPAIDALARESLVFERAYAPSPATSFSIASLHTGRHAYALSRLGKLEGRSTLADRLRAAGYRTMALFPPAVYFVEGARLRSLSDRHYGFERVVHDSHDDTRDAPARTEGAIRMLDEEIEAPVFLWVHYFGPHEPYVDHPEVIAPFGPRDSDRYDSEVRWVDEHLGRLLAHLRRTRPRAVIVITADHGEEFGEHGGAYHGSSLHDEQVRVPLLVRVPGRPAARLPHPVSTVDVAPTLLGLAGVPAASDGIDLLAAAEAGVWPPVFAEMEALKMVALESDKLICDAPRAFCRLYDLERDPGERRDVAAERPRRVAALRALLRDWLARAPADDDGADAPAEDPRLRTLRQAARADGAALAASWSILADRNAPAAIRVEAARVVASPRSLAPAPALGRLWAREQDPLVRAWIGLLTVRSGDRRALEELRAAGAHLLADPEFRAHRALSLARVKADEAAAEIASALGLVEDVRLRCALFGALGETRDPAATPLLLESFRDVRTRVCVSQALERLGDRASAGFILERLRDDPYLTVRVVLARALERIIDPGDAGEVHALLAREPDETVRAALAAALARLAGGPPAPPATRAGPRLAQRRRGAPAGR